MNNNEQFQLGIDALKKNNLNEAEKIFLNLSKKNPLNYDIIHFLGISYLLLGKLDRAKECFKKTIKIKPDFTEAYKHLGDVFYKQGKIDKAEIYYNSAIKLKPDHSEVISTLNVISEQKKVLSHIKEAKISKNNNSETFKTGLTSDPFIVTRPVEKELITNLYELDSVDLNKTKDVRYGNGKCSPDLRLFENNISFIKNFKRDLVNVMKKSVRSEIYIVESFFNILSAGSGTSPHKHIDPFDKAHGIVDQKYSLVYYLCIGDQNCSEPGILRLYDPDKKILPTEGLIVIFPANRKHSSTYNGNKDRIMVGVNFYCL